MSDLIKLSRRGSDGVFTTIWETRVFKLFETTDCWDCGIFDDREMPKYPRAQEYENSFTQQLIMR